MTTDPVETLRRLVAIPSVNPMGRGLTGPEFGEARLTGHLEDVFRQLGLEWQRQTVEPGRDNLIACLEGDPPPERGGSVLMLTAHQDTVPVDGMMVDPWTAVVRDGRLFGRGACDTKGGMAAMLSAVTRLAHERPRARPTVVIACTVNEEYGFSGATALSRLLVGCPGTPIPRRPDAAVVAEPTGLDVVVAHKGVLRWRCHARGRAAHSACPTLGDNAIYKMGRALAAFDRYARDVVPTLATHPLCGAATLSVGTIVGGSSVNTVPEQCTVEIDRRLPPGEVPEQAHRHAVEFFAGAAGLDFPLQHDPPYMQGLPLSDESNGPVAKQLAAAVRGAAGECSLVGVPYATDAASFAAAGVPSVVFGPGSIAQAHTRDEWLPLDQLEQAAEILYRFIRRFEAGKPAGG